MVSGQRKKDETHIETHTHTHIIHIYGVTSSNISVNEGGNGRTVGGIGATEGPQVGGSHSQDAVATCC